MTRFDLDFILGVARSLDARAERWCSGSYMRKLLKEQADKCREAANRK